MANIKSAEKRASQAVQRRAQNMTQRSRMRTAIKKVRAAIEAGKPEDAAAALKAAQPVIDGMVTKGIIHKNAGARYKSRLSAGVKGTTVKVTAVKVTAAKGTAAKAAAAKAAAAK